MVVKTAGVKVKIVAPLTEPAVAVIVAVETAVPVAKPVLVRLAVEVFEELQVTAWVRSCVLPSVYVPVATNCWVVPDAIDGLAGVTAMETSAGGFTVQVMDALRVPEVAVRVVVPATKGMANPAELIVATLGTEDAQLTVWVRSAVVPLL
jgi:hypothetical protein